MNYISIMVRQKKSLWCILLFFIITQNTHQFFFCYLIENVPYTTDKKPSKIKDLIYTVEKRQEDERIRLANEKYQREEKKKKELEILRKEAKRKKKRKIINRVKQYYNNLKIYNGKKYKIIVNLTIFGGAAIILLIAGVFFLINKYRSYDIKKDLINRFKEKNIIVKISDIEETIQYIDLMSKEALQFSEDLNRIMINTQSKDYQNILANNIECINTIFNVQLADPQHNANLKKINDLSAAGEIINSYNRHPQAIYTNHEKELKKIQEEINVLKELEIEDKKKIKHENINGLYLKALTIILEKYLHINMYLANSDYYLLNLYYLPTDTHKTKFYRFMSYNSIKNINWDFTNNIINLETSLPEQIFIDTIQKITQEPVSSNPQLINENYKLITFNNRQILKLRLQRILDKMQNNLNSILNDFDSKSKKLFISKLTEHACVNAFTKNEEKINKNLPKVQ